MDKTQLREIQERANKLRLIVWGFIKEGKPLPISAPISPYFTDQLANAVCNNDIPALITALTEARETMLDTAESVLYSKILAGDITALIFFLKTQGKSRGYIERVSPGPYLEIFARVRHNEKWTVWGNEAPETAEGEATT